MVIFLDLEDSYKYCLFSLGYGICTTQGFRKEDVLLEYKGDVVTTEVAARRRKIHEKRAKGCFIYGAEHKENIVW